MNLTLYYKPSCPYCIKTLRFMENQNIDDIVLKDTRDLNTRQELISIGGKGQVPCLIIKGQALYESDDIIDYLKRKYD